MLILRHTPNFAGIEVSGDFMDLDALYLALHTVVGDEGEFGDHEGARLRVLGVCYDLRHAFMGDREAEFVPNGMDEARMRLMGMIAPEKNLYYKCNVYYPEVLFVTIALNDFIRLYAKSQAKTAPFPLMDKRNLWDASIANVRLFQSSVVNCVKETVSDASYKRMRNLLHKDYTWTNGYETQYVDMLNIRYLNTENKEERQKSLPVIVKRMVEKGKQYQELERDVKEMARAHNCSDEDISLSWDYPEEIDW